MTAIPSPSVDDTLDERVRVRLFPEMRTRIESEMALHPGRWENISHFFRAAAAHFLHHLEQEARNKKKEERGA